MHRVRAGLAIVTVLAGLRAAAASEPVRVDFTSASGRKDTATPDWHEWQVPDGPTAETTIAGLKIGLTPLGGGTLKGELFKAGLVTGATMATDGVTAVEGDAPRGLVVSIAGLSEGEHQFVTYHNSFGKESLSKLRIAVVGDAAPAEDFVVPTVRAVDNAAAAHGFLRVKTPASGQVQLRIHSEGGGENTAVILNGLEIDAVDPDRRACRPRPANLDEHVDCDAGSAKLSWEPSRRAAEQHLFVAMADDAKEAADLLAAQTTDDAVAKLPASQTTYNLPLSGDAAACSRLYVCWRVDAVDGDGATAAGDVWRFRPRSLAFPGAEGYGRFARGGRHGKVLHVTTLADGGPGSLRAAVEAEGPRTIVFDVSGRIVLESRLVIRNPYLTIAGQTAPGKGICVSNYNLGMLGAHDCIVRHIRVRPGDTAGVTLDGMGMASADHSIIDHCSISWSHDEAFSSRGAKNITLQRTLISEALNIAGHKKYEAGKQHGYAASIGGDVGSFHHNLLAHCSGRNWSLAGGVDQATVHSGRLDLRNNVVFNWGHRTTDGGAKEVNFVNNYYKPGPASDVFHVLKPEHQLPFGPQRYYVAGNVMEGRYGADDRYAGVAESPGKPMREYIVDEPFFEPFVKTSTAEAALGDVLADVGCNRPQLDDHDRRVIDEVREGKTTFKGSVSGLPGLPDSQADVGGWEEYPEVHRPAEWDADGDGMPSEWEKAQGLDPNSPAGDLADAHGDADRDGFTNLEEYLNEL